MVAVYKETRLPQSPKTEIHASRHISDTYGSTAAIMSPAASDPCSDHSYELPLWRNLRLLLDLLCFIVRVLLDRLGVPSPCQGEVRLPGHPWGGEHHPADGDDDDDDDAALERFLEARFWEAGLRSIAAPRYRRRRAVRRPEDDRLGDGEGAAVCAICLAGLEAGGCQTVAELCGCSHAFHAACIDAWAGSAEAATCPLCRAPMLPTAPDDAQSLWTEVSMSHLFLSP